MEGLEPSGRSLLLKVSILYVAITCNYINYIEISITLAVCTAQRSNKVILHLQEMISVMPSRRLRQLTKRTWPTALAWLKPMFGRMQLKRWLTSTSSCQPLREDPFAREPAHTTSRVMLRSRKIKSRMYMEKRQRACSRLLKPTSWPIQMPKYENSYALLSPWCVCFFFFSIKNGGFGLALVFSLCFVIWEKLQVRESIHYILLISVCWCGHMPICNVPFLFASKHYCIVQYT